MDTIFMNSINSKTSDPHRLLRNFSDKINLKRSDKYAALSNFSIQYTQKNIKNSYKNNNFKLSAPTWNHEFQLPDGSYFVSDIQDYFVYIFKKRGEKADNPSIRIYINKIENRITLKIKTGFYLKFLTPETIKLPRSNKSKMNKDKNVKMCLMQRFLKQYQSIVILLIIIINKIQESCIHLFLINCLVNYQIFLLKNLHF